MGSVLFVCTANQCRSPMAEALFKAHLSQSRENNKCWQVQSAGLWANDHSPATSNAQAILRTRGLDISSHRSQPVTKKLLSSSNLVLCMTENHKRQLQKDFPEYSSRIFLLSEMVGKVEDITDPIGLSRQSYIRIADEINDYINEGIQKILSLAKTNH
mgnify:CR=1 FL=1